MIIFIGLDSKLCNWIAIQSLFDPQSFADRLFGLLESRTNEKFEIRLLQMALCARIIGAHKLQTLGFYSYLYRYLQPRQREVFFYFLYILKYCKILNIKLVFSFKITFISCFKLILPNFLKI